MYLFFSLSLRRNAPKRRTLISWQNLRVLLGARDVHIQVFQSLATSIESVHFSYER
jgi:hypothetical protein